jgi:TnpA family transposase
MQQAANHRCLTDKSRKASFRLHSRDAPFVLDGILYNESDLDIQEHYTDTHDFTDTNFAAFAMYGKRFSPRIKGLHKHAIFRIDTEKDYGPVAVLLEKKDRTLNPGWIADQWDRMGHFYASLESGHATASTALRRLNGFTGKNHFYRANRELGRVIRTEHTLDFMSDPDMRRRTRRGLLKGEQVHNLAQAHSHFPGQIASSAGQAFAIRFNKFQRPALK